MTTPVQQGNVSVSGASVTVSTSPSVTGSSWLRGAGVPTGAVGNDGDFYVDTNNFAGFYGPRVQGQWGSIRLFVTGSGAVNLNASQDPSVSNDATQGFGVASIWFNKTSGTTFICSSAIPGQAVWAPLYKVGSANGTLAAGNDPRITGATQASNNLSDVSSPSAALLNLGGRPLYFVRPVTASVTANLWEVVKANATTAAVNVTLPTASIPSMQVIIKKTDNSANTVTATASGGATIDGAATVVLSTQNAMTRLISDGTNWTAI